MKNLIKIICLLVFTLVFISKTVAQTDQNDILIKGLSTTEEIKLRWMPEDLDIWQDGIDYGYKVERWTLSDGEKQYSLQDQNKSKVTLQKKYTPVDAGKFPASKLGDVASALIYQELPAENSGNNNLADAMAYRENVESKYLFSLIVAEQDFEIAIAQALGLNDNKVKYNHQYLYKLSINTGTDTHSSSYVITHTEDLDLPIPVELKGYGAHLTANLEWNIRDNNAHYNFYNIERSSGDKFAKVNETPFTFISDADEDPEKAYYVDSLENNEKIYKYRIVGVTPFGINSAPSKVIAVQGKPKALDLAMSIDSLYEKNEGKLIIDWTGVTHEYDNHLSHFDVYMRKTHNGTETKMNSSKIGATKRTIQLTNIPSDAYYRLEAVDKNGHTYSTLPKAGRIKDITPPEAPVGFAGKILKDGTVLLQWEENTESDLEGYKVFYSNAINGEYVQTQPYIFKENEHQSSIDVNVETDSIYYKVAAYDYRLNRSVFTEALRLERPDNVAPSQPHIAQVVTIPDQIRLSFRLSNTADVETYYLERKVVESTSWTTLLEFSAKTPPSELPLIQGEDFASHYIDEDELEIRYYHYRLVAEDNHGNKSSSILQKVKPYDDMIRGTVTDFELLVRSDEELSLAAQNGGVYSGNNELLTELKEVDLGLLWEYDTKYDFSLREFKIYMQELPEDINPNSTAADHYPNTLIRTIPAAQAESTGLAMGNDKYGYLHTLSKVNEMKYVFKVIAYHNDGGTSTFSDSQTFPQ